MRCLMLNKTRKKILSAIQPSGELTLGNYLGTIQSWKKMIDQFECVFFVADLHAITVRQDQSKFRESIFRVYALLLACGIDLNKCVFFVQSHVHEHSEIAWILNCFSPVGELSRMTQYKDKCQKNSENINAGLLTYPSLMAGDILLYDANLVPVGKDQSQHLEFTRNLAIRFNGIYGDTFVVPEGFIPKVGSRIMSLKNPEKKMSKSGDPDSCIFILDDDDSISKKIKRAVTDSGSEIKFEEGKLTGINNLMTIYSALRGISLSETEAEFAGKGYGAFKSAVSELIIDKFKPIRGNFDKIISDKQFLIDQFRLNAEKASEIASKKLKIVKEKMGYINF